MRPQSPPRLILTRPDPENTPWLRDLSALGVPATAWPLIDIVPAPTQPDLLGPLWRSLAQFRAVMFVSRSAVQHFFARRPAGLAWPAPTRAWCTGPGTRRALIDHGLTALDIDAPPAGSTWDTEHLWPVVQAQVAPGHRFLMVRGTDATAAQATGTVSPQPTPTPDQGVGRDWLARQVTRMGGEIDWAVAYIRAQPQWEASQIQRARQATQDGSVWVFSSTQALVHLEHLLPGLNWQKTRALATHERIAQKARELGLGQVLVCPPAPPDLAASLKCFT